MRNTTFHVGCLSHDLRLCCVMVGNQVVVDKLCDTFEFF